MYSGWRCVKVLKCVCVLFRCGSRTCSVHTSHASPFLCTSLLNERPRPPSTNGGNNHHLQPWGPSTTVNKWQPGPSTTSTEGPAPINDWWRVPTTTIHELCWMPIHEPCWMPTSMNHIERISLLNTTTFLHQCVGHITNHGTMFFTCGWARSLG